MKEEKARSGEKFFGAVIDGERFRLPKVRHCDPSKPSSKDTAGNLANVRLASFVVDLDTKVIIKDRTGEFTLFNDAPILRGKKQ